MTNFVESIERRDIPTLSTPPLSRCGNGGDSPKMRSHEPLAPLGANTFPSHRKHAAFRFKSRYWYYARRFVSMA
jgi:hypothetical protein